MVKILNLKMSPIILDKVLTIEISWLSIAAFEICHKAETEFPVSQLEKKWIA